MPLAVASTKRKIESCFPLIIGIATQLQTASPGFGLEANFECCFLVISIPGEWNPDNDLIWTFLASDQYRNLIFGPCFAPNSNSANVWSSHPWSKNNSLLLFWRSKLSMIELSLICRIAPVASSFFAAVKVVLKDSSPYCEHASSAPKNSLREDPSVTPKIQFFLALSFFLRFSAQQKQT